MLNSILSLRKALNKAFLTVKVNRGEFESFKTNLLQLINQIDESESEEFHKTLVADFLKNTYYHPNYFINTKKRQDFVIHNGKNSQTKVGVILEAKKPSSKKNSEMLTLNNINTKALQQLVFYYLKERITENNFEIKHLIATNFYEWFIFSAQDFEKLFAEDEDFVKEFKKFKKGEFVSTKTDFFYKNIAQPAINKIEDKLKFIYFDLREYQPLLNNINSDNENDLIPLFKTFAPENLLKLNIANDSNSLNKAFYSELLHLIGLTEVKKGGKKLIKRKKEGERNAGSLLENAITEINISQKLSRLKDPFKFGNDKEEQTFAIALELTITWVNRILFLKLLEAQLINYNKGDLSFSFLNFEKLNNYNDLNRLFFNILACIPEKRKGDFATLFNHIPYLNSSLFDHTELEYETLFINNLSQENLPLFNSTVLKDNQGNKCTGSLNTLQYLFEFLNAYNFSNDSSNTIEEENKTLINASVLGLIFEKINGYKDGSFFTPGFITMYMCRETIHRAVLQKFKEVKGWNCQNIDQLYDKIDDKIEANTIINSIKICDPAVGSGHFLVSALNEMIALKSELKILLDRKGKTLRDYHIEVINDELIVIDDEGNLFKYNPQNNESQRVQETLFHEKQTIIENCLFGVDINNNSVKICRLRLWIELLKNSYYKNNSSTGILPVSNQKNKQDAYFTRELETLPNIDINIKCGNSLISRFALDSNLKTALKKNNCDIETYQNAVKTYRNAENKEQKGEMVKLIETIKSNFSQSLANSNPKKVKLRKLENERDNLENQLTLLEETKKEQKAREKKITKLNKDINKLTLDIEEIETGRVYQDAFEWRFEFPEVLNNEGDFIGFDVIIGNPPYIRQEEFSNFKPLLKERFTIYNSIADLLTYFVELSFNLLKDDGVFQYIISNKFTRANYGKQMRGFLVKNTSLTHFIDFSGVSVFEEATVDAAILGFTKSNQVDNSLLYAGFKKDEFELKLFNGYLHEIKQSFAQGNLTENSWSFQSNQVLKIKHQVEAQGIPLKDWDISISRGILTGFNQAFIISGEKRQELIDKDSYSADIIKPILRGRDLQKYYPDFQDLWLINLHNGYKKDNQHISPLKAEDYPAIKEYLDQFFPKLKKRTDKGKTPYNLRNCAYIEDFEKPKIIYKDIAQELTFVYDDSSFYINNTNYMITGDFNLYYLVALLNSKLIDFYYRLISTQLGKGAVRLFTQFVEKIPVKQITEEEEKPFKKLVKQIMDLKKANPDTDTSKLEREIDELVYKLYELTEEEIKIIENE